MRCRMGVTEGCIPNSRQSPSRDSGVPLSINRNHATLECQCLSRFPYVDLLKIGIGVVIAWSDLDPQSFPADRFTLTFGYSDKDRSVDSRDGIVPGARRAKGLCYDVESGFGGGHQSIVVQGAEKVDSA